MDANGKNMDLRPAVQCAFTIEIFSKNDVYANISWPAHSVGLLFLFTGIFEKKSVSDTFSRLTQSEIKNF